MKDSKKIKYNLIWGIFAQAVAMVLGVLVPRLVLTNYGSEVNGLLSSVTNIYSYIAIVEAGVAAASCQALYKALSQKNITGANAVLSATNKYYHKTGLIYLGLIFAFSFFYPLLIKSNIPYTTIVLIIVFNGIGNVINYFFHGKYLILLKADGKNFVRSGLEIFSNSFKQIAKILLINFGFDVVSVQFIAMLTSFAQMIYITYYIKKHYSWINLTAKPDFSSISQSKNVFIHEFNYLITSNIDVVLLTIFDTLKTVSVYSMYTLLLNMINKVLRTIKDALEFKVAHVFHTDKERFLRLFECFEVYYITFAFSLYTVANIFFLPFLKLYTKGVNDANYLNIYLPFFFIIISLLSAGRYPSEAMIHIAGHFKLTQKSAIIESGINIAVSLALVNFYGIFGVLIGTIVSCFYRTNYLILYVNKNIILRSPKNTYKCWIINFLTYIILMLISRYLVFNIDSYIKLFAICVPYTIVIMGIYFVVSSVFSVNAFRFFLNILKKTLKIKA